MIVNAGYRGKVGASVPKFTYTGAYNVREDGVVELLTSGTLVFLSPAVIDRFMVGGGGAGGGLRYITGGAGGGGGGYTRTDKKLQMVANQAISVTIGDGGTTASDSSGRDGSPTSWGADTVNGGKGVRFGQSNAYKAGATGGSGGGGGTTSNSSGGIGGSDGSNGEDGGGDTSVGGAGSGITTREFGEATGKLYSGGGGGGRYFISSTPIYSIGGAGGGGAGGWTSTSEALYQSPTAGSANTGGGGGGGMNNGGLAYNGKSGGSGICCFRAAK